MTTVQTKYLGNLRTEAQHLQSGTIIYTDAPTDNHGLGQAFSPTDLLATALGSCMLTIMGISAQSYGFSIDGTRLEIQKIMAANPRRVAEIVIDFYFPEGQSYTPQAKRLIEAAARTCPVANSLHPDTIKTINFHYWEA